MLVDKTVGQILDAFASSSPTPGGGSASALAGAMGVALLLMVARMPRTKDGSAEDRGALDRAVETLAPLETELRALIDRDTQAYEAVVAAYKLPKGTEEEKGARRAAIQEAMRSAIDAPLAVMRACRQASVQGAIVGRHGNPNAASDVTVAGELLRAALNGARANVEINLGSVSDADYVARIREELGPPRL